MSTPQTIYQTKRGITLTDGYFLARNPRTHNVCVISINKGVVCIHDITRQMNLTDLVQFDSIGYLDVYERLQPMEFSKEKNKKSGKK